MDGKDLLRRLRQLLNEDTDSGWMDTQTSYDFLYEAAKELVDRTGCLRSTQSITTVADDDEYNLNPDFMRLYLRNSAGNYYIKLNDGSNNHFPTWKDYEDIVYDDNTTSVTIPSFFSIIDTAKSTQVTGTATSTSAASAGQCTLTDTAADFSDVNAGAIIHNTTDGSDGVVLSKTSSTVLVVALFGGTANDWTSSDAYVIQPQSRYQIYLTPPPSTAGYTITVYYIQQPAPVYSDYGIYRFSDQYKEAMVKYAFWLYKYRDKEPDMADSMYKFWDVEMGRKAYNTNRAQRPGGFKVNLKNKQ
jgi:hypothetical protein